MSDIMFKQLQDRISERRFKYPSGCDGIATLDWVDEQIREITTKIVFEECGNTYKVFRRGELLGILYWNTITKRILQFTPVSSEDEEGDFYTQKIEADEMIQIAKFIAQKNQTPL